MEQIGKLRNWLDTNGAPLDEILRGYTELKSSCIESLSTELQR
jgi:hypothetical protein